MRTKILLLLALLVSVGFNLYQDKQAVFEYDASSKVAGSGSMLPIIPINATIYYDEATAETELNVNDIIVFDRNGTRIIHSIVTIFDCGGETLYITKGLNNIYADEPIRREQILLKVVRIDMNNR